MHTASRVTFGKPSCPSCGGKGMIRGHSPFAYNRLGAVSEPCDCQPMRRASEDDLIAPEAAARRYADDHMALAPHWRFSLGND